MNLRRLIMMGVGRGSSRRPAKPKPTCAEVCKICQQTCETASKYCQDQEDLRGLTVVLDYCAGVCGLTGEALGKDPQLCELICKIVGEVCDGTKDRTEPYETDPILKDVINACSACIDVCKG